ncbi:MAG: polysaccharide biosynthesis C-terminal domain-containing protein [Bacteroidota bacterium]|nr:polysaccharide biosynthesis C-terminal domain-containing protein [Bacteroidota bacterium]
MFKKIAGTIGTRFLATLITFIIVLTNTHFLGAANFGTINLIILAIALIQLLNNFVGGSALVYLVPREDLLRLYIPSVLWSAFISVSGVLLLWLLKLIPEGYTFHVMALSLIYSFLSVNLMVLLGKEWIHSYNLITLLQTVCLLTVLIIFIFLLNERTVMSYINGLYVSYILAFILSMIKVFPWLHKGSLKGTFNVIKKIIHYGSVMQTGNIIQLLNYRLSYYFIEMFFGRASVGIYSAGVQLSECIWLIPKSISMVQYSRLSNEGDKDYALRTTLSFLKVSILITLFALIVILLIPNSFLVFLFGKEFGGVKLVMISLAAGILVFTISIILSPFFSGQGKPIHNTISAAAGLVFTVAGSLILLPRIGIAGAGITASISYFASTLYQWIVFRKFTRFRIRDLVVTREEVSLLFREISRLFK